MTWSLRPATAADIAALAALERVDGLGRWGAVAFGAELQIAWSHVIVAQQRPGAPVLGFMVYWCVADEVQLLNIAVHPAARRSGVGRALMQHLLQQAHAATCARVVLEVRRGNTAAQRFYAVFGFAAVGVRVAYYPDTGEDAMVLQCELRQC